MEVQKIYETLAEKMAWGKFKNFREAERLI
jgi:hypothetical protein